VLIMAGDTLKGVHAADVSVVVLDLVLEARREALDADVACFSVPNLLRLEHQVRESSHRVADLAHDQPLSDARAKAAFHQHSIVRLNQAPRRTP